MPEHIALISLMFPPARMDGPRSDWITRSPETSHRLIAAHLVHSGVGALSLVGFAFSGDDLPVFPRRHLDSGKDGLVPEEHPWNPLINH